MTDTQTGSTVPNPSPNGFVGGRDWLRQLHWRQFEDVVASAYRRQGYTVLPTAPGADGGIDLILIRGNERIFVQCKHWRASQVGAPVVRELFGLVVANRATRGIVVTSGTFSREARAFAKQTNTQLLDGPAVLALLTCGDARGPVASTPAVAPISTPKFPPGNSTAPSCPICLSEMRLRRARRGRKAGTSFWGCVRFPGCRGTLAAAPTNRRSGCTALAAALVAVPVSIAVIAVGAVVASTLMLRLPAPQPAGRAQGVSGGQSSASATGSGVRQGEQPMAIAVSGSGKRLYTANFASGDVTVIDSRTMQPIETIDVPGRPNGIAVADGSLYVADRANAKVHVIDLKKREVTRKFAAGKRPGALAVDPGADRLFVASGKNDTVRAYSLRTGQRVGTISASRVSALAVDTTEHELHVRTSLGLDTSYDARSLGRIAHTFVGGSGGMAMDSKRQRLYLTVVGSRLRESNLLTGGSRDFDLGIEAQAVAVDPKSRNAYVADPDASRVEKVSLK